VVKTNIAGYIVANPNLTNGASVILNEVTSTKPTKLYGYTEVAGKKADVVIANPNGISINGAGFINSHNVTLSTGKPQIQQGALHSYNVKDGKITITGNGLDVSRQDSASIYARFLKLNAKINARNLKIRLGKNNITYKTDKIIKTDNNNDKNAPNLSFDSSLLGGMYVDKISIIGTEKGLGVNMPPEVLSSQGDITITADGKVKLQQLHSNNNINISSKSADIEVNENIYAKNDNNLSAHKNITIKKTKR
jgi:filamentous hemagglutinin